ncbi:MAG: SEL1-like repeat protein, partial [Litorimonas sp.]
LPPFQPPSGLAPPPPPAPGLDDFEPAPLPDAVYANPAYAEDGSPLAVRIADSGQPKRKRRTPLTRKLSGSGSPLTGRNVRLALLVGATALALVLAARVILASPENPDPSIPQGGSVTFEPAALETETVAFVPPEDATAEPIGAYAEREPVVIDPAELGTLEAAVAAGNPVAQFQMGLARLDAGDTETGAALIRQSAEANQPAALYRLAKLHEAGEGVAQDDTLARQFIERAARGGNRIAMHDLALYYTEGRGGVELDMQTARSWFEQAARRGVVDSQFNLGVLSESTEVGGAADQTEALFWYSIAATQGDQFAVSRRDTLRAGLTPAQLAEVETRIAAFQPRPIDEAANGIFTDVPWIKADAPATNPQVRQVQTLLTSLGYSVGPADGLMGERTRTAITEFERSNGLTETGEVSAALIQRLANAAGA